MLKNIVLVLVLVLWPVFGYSSLFRHGSNFYYHAGLERMQAHQWDAALTNFDKAIELTPNDTNAFIARGDVRYVQGDYRAALDEYHHAVQLAPDLAPVSRVPAFGHTSITNDISNHARVLLATTNYAALEDLARQLRSFRDKYPDGTWQLSILYDGLLPSDSATTADWDRQVNEIANWATAVPDSITAKIAYANALNGYAWQLRGTGVSPTPGSEQLFRDKTLESIFVLRDLRTRSDECPIYWHVMLKNLLANGVSRPNFDKIFGDAIRANRTEYDVPAYYLVRATFLLPAWGGAPGDWGVDLAMSANRIGGDEGDKLYAQIVWQMDEQSCCQIFSGSHIVWSRVDRGFQVIASAFPDSLDVRIERAKLALQAQAARSPQP